MKGKPCGGSVMTWGGIQSKPIENAWGYLVHHVYKDGKQYYSLNDLREAITLEKYVTNFCNFFTKTTN